MRINGIDISGFHPQSKAALIAIGLRSPGVVTVDELIPLVYPDPDQEPDSASGLIRRRIRMALALSHELQARLKHQSGPPGGYRLEKPAK